jgi:hypothetical protein
MRRVRPRAGRWRARLEERIARQDADLKVRWAERWSLSSSAGTGPATVRITNREISRVRVDSGRSERRGPGDVEIIRQNLFNKRSKSRPIGHADYVCTFVTRATRHCTATLFLAKGRLVAGGSIRFPELYELAVLGGTRLYDNARGTLTVIRTTEGHGGASWSSGSPASEGSCRTAKVPRVGNLQHSIPVVR